MLAERPVARASAVNVCVENFDEIVLRQDRVPVLVEFWAPWCEPCLSLAPTLDYLAVSLAGSVVIAKVNVDEQGALATAARVRAVPTLHLIRAGRLVDVMLGVHSRRQLRARLIWLLTSD